ncbi:MAG: glycoside hydrolase family 127 protein [Clostridia bacterium]|nr:glycoside hydrolase family 127 protein [Clostridia bacterium]
MARKENPTLTKLPVGSIRPEGWLLRELQLVNGLQKRLGAISGLTENGAWVQGEALPRYIRGLVLLYGALGDKILLDKAQSFLSSILTGAKEGGDFGPQDKIFGTAKIEGLKAVYSYYELTGDENALQVLRKFFKNQFNTFSVTPYFYHARARLLEEIPAIEAVFKETDAEWLHDLGEKLRETSNDWFKLASNFKYKSPASRYISSFALKKLKKRIESFTTGDGQNQPTPLTVEKANIEWKKPAHQAVVETTGVNIAKAIKYPCVWGKFIGDKDLKNHSIKLINALDKYHGNILGTFNSDLRLAGRSFNRGVDVEVAVEMLESLVEVLAETGDSRIADRIERIAFNLIPSAFDGMGAVEDILTPNQVEVSCDGNQHLKDSRYGNAYVSSRLTTGALAMLSAYPLFMRSVCFEREGELDFKCYAPCVIDTTIDGKHIRIKEETGYPFRNTIIFKVESAEGDPELKINFRVPCGTSMQLVSGGQVVASGTSDISVKCVLKTGSTFMLKMDIPLLVRENNDKSLTMMKGNLVMASKLAEEVKETASYKGVYRVKFLKKWTFAPIVSKRKQGGVRRLFDNEEVIVNTIAENPFSSQNPPFELRVRSKNVTDWDYDREGLVKMPSKPEFSEESMARLYVPFGCTKIRISQFPRCFKG